MANALSACFQPLGPGAEVTSSVVSDVAYGEVEDLEYGVVSGEMPPGFRDFSVTGSSTTQQRSLYI